MKEIWIVGFGHFGQRAARELAGRRGVRLVVVDSLPQHMEEGKRLGYESVLQDGVSFVVERLEGEGGKRPQWIVPALPVHLAFEWVMVKLGKSAGAIKVPVPLQLDPMLPHPLRGPGGEVYVTHATFRCPDDCPEPKNICTVTQKPRPQDMFELLSRIRFSPWRPLVIRSHQLAPGVGGYRAESLFRLLREVQAAHSPLLIATACRCHGVISAMEVD